MPWNISFASHNSRWPLQTVQQRKGAFHFILASVMCFTEQCKELCKERTGKGWTLTHSSINEGKSWPLLMTAGTVHLRPISTGFQCQRRKLSTRINCLMAVAKHALLEPQWEDHSHTMHGSGYFRTRQLSLQGRVEQGLGDLATVVHTKSQPLLNNLPAPSFSLKS